MRKVIMVMITGLVLLLPGCGKAEASSGSEVTQSIPELESPEDKYIECIENYELNISTKYSNRPDSTTTNKHTMYMIYPEILEVNDTVITAKGKLSDNTFASVDTIQLNYTLEPYVDSYIVSNVSSLPECILIKPSVVLDGNYLYEITNIIRLVSHKDATGTDITLNLDNFPSVELSENGWIDDFTWTGILTFIDYEGNTWVSEEQTIKYSGIDGEYKWRAEHMVILVYPAE